MDPSSPIQCVVDGTPVGQGDGSRPGQAKELAAKAALANLRSSIRPPPTVTEVSGLAGLPDTQGALVGSSALVPFGEEDSVLTSVRQGYTVVLTTSELISSGFRGCATAG